MWKRTFMKEQNKYKAASITFIILWSCVLGKSENIKFLNNRSREML